MPDQNVFPTRDNCDPTDPTEALLWMFAGLPGDLWMPIAYFRMISQRFWDLGARPVEDPLLQLVPPAGGGQSWREPGRWVRIDGAEEPSGEPGAPPRELPTRENCDLTNPEEAFLWMFVALPHLRGGPMILSVYTHKLHSKRLWQLGARPSADPVLEYLPSGPNEPNWATSAGRWVPVGTVTKREKDVRAVRAGLAKMGHQQKVDLKKALLAWRSGQPIPDTIAGQVVVAASNYEKGLILQELTSDSA